MCGTQLTCGILLNQFVPSRSGKVSYDSLQTRVEDARRGFGIKDTVLQFFHIFSTSVFFYPCWVLGSILVNERLLEGSRRGKAPRRPGRSPHCRAFNESKSPFGQC